ncbi:MAG: AAA family ATPase, partial [Actinomycetia bacterium]|nr:AAA family ATPase [Actinomycetes bacterium]
EYLFGEDGSLIQIDMSEYMEKHTVSRLIGSPPGYVGYEEGGQLTEAVRRRSYCVVLLDEIEKAHHDVFNILLQILEDGRLTDAQGRSVDFKNVIMIMTSNLGARYIQKATPLGFSKGGSEALSYKDMKEKVTSELKRTFRPEFLNRIDDVIVFHELARNEIKEIIGMLIKRLGVQLDEQKLSIELSEAAEDVLVDEGYEPSSGARPLRRAIQRLIEDPLSEALLRKQFKIGDVITVDGKDGSLVIQVKKRKEVKVPAPVGQSEG